MNRQQLKNIALIRLQEVEVLLKNRQYSGAYYLSGYAIECALKACIAKQTKRFDFPDLNFVRKSYTHDLTQLVNNAKLKAYLDTEKLSDPLFAVNWSVVTQWSEESRYEKHTRAKAEEIYLAITDTNHGVLKWVKLYW